MGILGILKAGAAWLALDPALPRVVHLHRRAAFAGTWGELQRDLRDGPEKAVQRLLDGAAMVGPRTAAEAARRRAAAASWSARRSG